MVNKDVETALLLTLRVSCRLWVAGMGPAFRSFMKTKQNVTSNGTLYSFSVSFKNRKHETTSKSVSEYHSHSHIQVYIPTYIIHMHT